MPSAGLEVQKSVYTALTGDAALVSLLGGAHVFDDVPHDAAFPYLTFGRTTVRDWSTGDDEGHEHLLTLHVWSHGNGRRETHEIMSTIEDVLHDAPLSVAGHKLVNLRHEFSDAQRDADGETYHGILRYRAVTEPM